ncbi:hypothetical protein [Streptomyces sp. NPDC014676]|uniref:hypothetical protein n=1 Tax=Streptomyces sp. NPDC014676 TaxID=3364879 RepID=UPI0036F9C02F
MSEDRKSPRPSRGRRAGRHRGSGHHGWSPDVDETRQEENPSARRSFHAEEYVPSRGAGRKHVEEERTSVPGDVVRGDARWGEEYADRGEAGKRGTGRRGRSARPGGTGDEAAFTGVDPGDSGTGRRPG